LHDAIWDLAVAGSHRDLIAWLHDDLCSHRELPKNLFPADIEVEYHFGDLVNFLTVPEDISLYLLEQQLYNKLKRYTIIEQRIQQGRTQIRDDADLKKAIVAAKSSNPNKPVVVFYCMQNLENKPIAQPPSATDNSLKPITKLRTMASESATAPEKNNATNSSTTSSGGMSAEQFTMLKNFLEKSMSLKDLEKEVKKVAIQVRHNAQQNADIYDEIQNIKTNDRNFISTN